MKVWRSAVTPEVEASTPSARSTLCIFASRLAAAFADFSSADSPCSNQAANARCTPLFQRSTVRAACSAVGQSSCCRAYWGLHSQLRQARIYQMPAQTLKSLGSISPPQHTASCLTVGPTLRTSARHLQGLHDGGGGGLPHDGGRGGGGRELGRRVPRRQRVPLRQLVRLLPLLPDQLLLPLQLLQLLLVLLSQVAVAAGEKSFQVTQASADSLYPGSAVQLPLTLLSWSLSQQP